MKKFGVKLESYPRLGRINAWVYDGVKRAVGNFDEMTHLRNDYAARNPQGVYVVEEITDDAT